MTSRPGEIWLAEILFTGGSVSKIRPVLILWLDADDAVVAAVTSAAPRSLTDVSLADWTTAGLRLASTVRLSRLDCLEQIVLRRRLGALSLNDSQRIKQTWAGQIRLQC
jgi:mRNA interferase MazF